MVPEFIDAIYKLQTTGRLYTADPYYLWLAYCETGGKGSTLKPYDEEKVELKQKVSKDGRSEISRNAVLDKDQSRIWIH